MNDKIFRVTGVVILLFLALMYPPQVVAGVPGVTDYTKYVLKLYVSPSGNDDWSGNVERPNKKKTDGPLATLEKARELIREFKTRVAAKTGNILVEVASGTYEITKALELTEQDGGFGENARVFYRGKRGGDIRFIAGKRIVGWKPVTDERILSVLDPSVRNKMWQADLGEMGLEDFGSPNGGGMELFFNDRPMWLSRDPNSGFVKIAELLNADPFDRKGNVGDYKGQFVYDDGRVGAWKDERDAWVHGYWCYDWSEESHKVAAIDTQRKILEVLPPYHKYGYRLNQWFYGFNLLSKIDEAGEYYIDRETRVLYFYPPGDVEQGESYVTVRRNLINMERVANVTIEGITFEGCRGTAIQMDNCNNVLIAGCTVRNTGGWAISVDGGKYNGVVSCNIYGTGSGGISVNAGDRIGLNRGNSYIENNYIHHIARIKRTYNPGITLNGVGNRATHNLICHVPHMAMGFSGNDQLLEFNEIYDACYESNDAGAIYTGFNLTMRGNIIRHNYLHDISGFEGKGCVGIYLDDMFSSARIEGNIFKNVTRAAMIGGGRDNEIVNNIFIDCIPSLHVDARGLGWFGYHVDAWLKEANERGTLSGRDIAILFDKEPYRTRYPQLVGLLGDEPRAPKGNVISNNICVGGVWDKRAGIWHSSIDTLARKYLRMENNIVSPESAVEDEKSSSFLIADPMFAGKTDPASKRFSLDSGSPALSKGFRPIPFDSIGLYIDEFRRGLPAK